MAAKGPIKSTAAAKKARNLVTYKGNKSQEKKAAKKELKSAGANMQRVMSAKPAAGSTHIKYSAMVDTLKAGSRANEATKRAVDAKVSARAATKAVGKGQKMVLKGEVKRTKTNAKALKKTEKVSKKFGM